MAGNHYAEILLALSRGNVRFVVAGGVAVVLHGVERLTMDIDVAVDFEPENLRRFVEVTKQLDLKPRVPVANDFIADPANVKLIVEEKNAIVFTYIDPSNPLKHLDVFLTEDHSYERLARDSMTITLEDQSIRVASPRTLIALKKRVTPPRAKDLHDISELEKLLDHVDE